MTKESFVIGVYIEKLDGIPPTNFSTPKVTTDDEKKWFVIGVYLENLAVYADKISTPQVTTDDDRNRSS